MAKLHVKRLIDEAAASDALKEAEKVLQGTSKGLDYSKAAIQLVEAAAQLRTIKAIKKKAR